MKAKITKIISAFLCMVIVFSICCTGSAAAENKSEAITAMSIKDDDYVPTLKTFVEYVSDPLMWIESLQLLSGVFDGLSTPTSLDSFAANIMKVLYNVLNAVVEKLVQVICAFYPDPNEWEPIENYTGENFLQGRETYQTTAKQGNYWSLGYSSRSVLPEDAENGSYFIGRDLMNKKAIGVYDDQRIRVTVIDDNSGEGAVVLGAIDALGITSTDVRSIREGVSNYCKENNIKVASINITATHAHSVLDTQGVSTQFIYKFLGNMVNNELSLFEELPFLQAPTHFKEYFVKQSIIAVEEAFEDVESGSMYFAQIDASEYIKDKRGLVAKEDIPKIASLYFEPDSGSESTYIADISCHPTSFSASNGYIGSDYIYYLDEYIKENTGSNLLMIQGAVGQLSRDNVDPDTSEMDKYESMGAQTKLLGQRFGELIISAEYSQELDPILNARHKDIFISAENSILVLACEVKLVNNKVYKTGNKSGDVTMASEIGYLEFGHRVGFALFPGEFYPEVFWGDDIIGGTNWDGSDWPYNSLANSVDGIDVYAVSLANDAIGYVLTDNNFAFMGHILGDGIADETLSAGKHMGSFLVSNYLDLIDELK